MAQPPNTRQLFGPVPTVQAILVCERIITESGTNKKTLIGVFDAVGLPVSQEGPPPAILGVHLFARLYDAAGRYSFRVDFVQADTERRIGQAWTEPVELEDPLSAFDFILPLPPLPLPDPGRYEFRLYANDVYLAHVGMRVRREGGPA